MCVCEFRGSKPSPGVEGEGDIDSEMVGEGHGEQIVQGARVKQSDHTLTTPTNDVRFTQCETPPWLSLEREK